MTLEASHQRRSLGLYLDLSKFIAHVASVDESLALVFIYTLLRHKIYLWMMNMASKYTSYVEE